MISELPAFVMWGFAGLIVLYIAVRIISGKMIIWEKAATSEDAQLFRSAILGYKPVWVAYAAWFGVAIATLLTINNDYPISYLPVIYVIAFQLWKLRTPRDYRGVVGKVMCATLPLTLAFYCLAYPVKTNTLVFALLLAWIAVSMLMQVVTMKAIRRYDLDSLIIRSAVFDKQNVFGQPGRGLGNSDLDAGNVEVGVLGEKKTASVLNALAAQNKNLYVFHSVAWLSDKTYDIDHAVYYKGNVIFIDSKFWGNGIHEIDADNFVYRDGLPRNMELHLPNALAEYQKRWSMMASPVNKTDVWVAVQGNDDNKVLIGKHNASSDVLLVAGSELAEQVENWISLIEEKGWARTTDKRALELFKDQLK